MMKLRSILSIHPRLKYSVTIVLLFWGSWIVGENVKPTVEYWICQDRPVVSFVIGLVVIMAIFLCLRSVVIAFYNYREEEKITKTVPQTFRDVSKLGIHSPVDYCAVMQVIFSYRKIPNLGFPSIFLKESRSPAAWDKALRLFQMMYGRNPYGSEATNNPSWGYYLMQEAKAALNRENAPVSTDELNELLSPEITKRMRHAE